MTYTLILTLLYGTPSITSVPGFTSLNACQAAGKAWAVDLVNVANDQHYLCVRVK
jgi:hypothetical protein